MVESEGQTESEASLSSSKWRLVTVAVLFIIILYTVVFVWNYKLCSPFFISCMSGRDLRKFVNFHRTAIGAAGSNLIFSREIFQLFPNEIILFCIRLFRVFSLARQFISKPIC